MDKIEIVLLLIKKKDFGSSPKCSPRVTENVKKETTMKSLLDSPEAFEAYATIDYCYWRLGELNKIMFRPRAPIERMVDEATGYDSDAKYYQEIKELLEAIIESKTFIEADSKEDKKILEHCKNKISYPGIPDN